MLPAGAYIGGRGAALLVVRDGERWVGVPAGAPRRALSQAAGPALLAWVHTHASSGRRCRRAIDAGGGAARVLGSPGRTRGRATWARAAGRRGPVAAALEAPARARVRGVLYERVERAALRRRDGRATTSSRPRVPAPARAARQRRALERAHRARSSSATAPATPRPIEAFLALEASGWKGETGTALAAAGPPAVLRRAVPRARRRRAAPAAQPRGRRPRGGDEVQRARRRRRVLLQDRLRRGARPLLARGSARAREHRRLRQDSRRAWTDSCAWEHNR